MSTQTDQAFRNSATFDFTTDWFRPHERLDAMYALLGRRMNGTIAGDEGRWSVGVRGLASSRGEFLDYAAKGLLLDRPASMCDDGSDHISLGMVVGRRTAVAQNGRELNLTTGELYLIDFGRPIRNFNPDHHQMAVALPRAHVAAALGVRTGELGGLCIDGKTGIGAMLASHMRALGRHLATLDQQGRAMSLEMLTSLALTTIQTRTGMPADPQASDHLYAAARLMIRNRCADPDFDADRLAVELNCSRSTLYRLFARHEQKVATSIWQARLERAWAMMSLVHYADHPVSEIAFRCGFLEPATFSRLFKARFGITPTEAREAARAGEL